MRAARYSRSGSPDGLEIAEVPTPVPQDGEVLIRVRAASVNPLDYHLLRHPILRRFLAARSGKPISGPGRDVAGEVEAVGGGVTRFRPGDAVFGACGAAFSELACAAESALAAKPGRVTFEQAAAVPVAALTALQGLRDRGKLAAGQEVLICGAAGGVGTFAVQIARSLGARVTAVCSTGNVELVRSLGAGQVVDYRREDLARCGRRFDLVFDLVGSRSLASWGRLLEPDGTYIGAGGLGGMSLPGILAGQIAQAVRSRLGRQKFLSFMARVSSEDLTVLGQLLESGTVVPVIDRRFSLGETAAAIRYLETKHARGKVLILPVAAGTAR